MHCRGSCIHYGWKKTLQTFSWLSPRPLVELTQRSFALFKGATDDCVTTKASQRRQRDSIPDALSRLLQQTMPFFGLFACLPFNPCQSSAILTAYSPLFRGSIKYSCRDRKAHGQNLTKLVEMRGEERELLPSCEGWQ